MAPDQHSSSTLAPSSSPRAATRPTVPPGFLPPPLQSIGNRYSLTHATTTHLTNLSRSPSPHELLLHLSQAPGFPANILVLTPMQASFFKGCAVHPGIPWHPPRPWQSWHKIFLLFLVGCLPPERVPQNLSVVTRKTLNTEKAILLSVMDPILRATIDIFVLRSDAGGVHSALHLLRSARSRTFDTPCNALLQIPNIGPKKKADLETAGISTCQAFARLNAPAIERVLKRNPPFGESMRRTLANFPLLHVTARQVGRVIQDAGPGKMVISVGVGFWNESVPIWQGKKLSICLIVGNYDTGEMVFGWRGWAEELDKKKVDAQGQDETVGQDREPRDMGETTEEPPNLLRESNGEEDDTERRPKYETVMNFLVDNIPGSSFVFELSCEQVAGSLVEMRLPLV